MLNFLDCNFNAVLFGLHPINSQNYSMQYPRRTILQRRLYRIIFSSQSCFPARQGKLFQRCTQLLYCSVLSLGGNVNTRRMSKSDMGSIFHIKNQLHILVMGNHYVNYQNYQNVMLLTSSDIKLTLMHIFLFTNSAQRELVSICTQSTRNCN